MVIIQVARILFAQFDPMCLGAGGSPRKSFLHSGKLFIPRMAANEVTGANAGGLRQLAIWRPRAARIAQFWRSSLARAVANTTGIYNGYRFGQRHIVSS